MSKPDGQYCYDADGQCKYLLVPRSNQDLDKCLRYKCFIDRGERGKKPVKCEKCKEDNV